MRSPLRRTGFSNATLLAVVALVAVVTLLSLIQQGEIDPYAFVARPAPAAAARKKQGKAPALLPSARPALQAPATAEEPGAEAPVALDPRRELEQALAHMDGKAAAALLTELDPADAVALLSHLHERDWARILDEAHPADAAQWIEELLAQPVSAETQPGPASPATPDAASAAEETGAAGAPASSTTDTAPTGGEEQPVGEAVSPDASTNTQEEASGTGSEPTGSGSASAQRNPSPPQLETSIA